MGKDVLSLSVQGIYTAYDRADVLEDLSLEVVQGTITCLLGNNGSGKTTLIRSILGLTPPRTGSIFFQGTDITRLPTHRIIRQGVASIPEGRKVFPGLTVEENLLLGGYQEDDKQVLLSRMKKVYRIFPLLEKRSSQLSGTMSGGE
jgi:branched-chain amino acid transport system ATP-binding protein